MGVQPPLQLLKKIQANTTHTGKNKNTTLTMYQTLLSNAKEAVMMQRAAVAKLRASNCNTELAEEKSQLSKWLYALLCRLMKPVMKGGVFCSVRAWECYRLNKGFSHALQEVYDHIHDGLSRDAILALALGELTAFNVFFYILAYRMGQETLAAELEEFAPAILIGGFEHLNKCAAAFGPQAELPMDDSALYDAIGRCNHTIAGLDPVQDAESIARWEEECVKLQQQLRALSINRAPAAPSPVEEVMKRSIESASMEAAEQLTIDELRLEYLQELVLKKFNEMSEDRQMEIVMEISTLRM